VKSAVEEAELMAGVAVEKATVGYRRRPHPIVQQPRGRRDLRKGPHRIREDLRRVPRCRARGLDPAGSGGPPRSSPGVRPRRSGGITQPVGMNGSASRGERPHRHRSDHLDPKPRDLRESRGHRGSLHGVGADGRIGIGLDPRRAGAGRGAHRHRGGTTDLAIFERGSIWHTAVLPAGGDHFTNDLAVGLRPRFRTPSASRRNTAARWRRWSRVTRRSRYPRSGGRKPRMLSRQIMAEILQPRAEEIFT
jgi:hypothetical protein